MNLYRIQVDSGAEEALTTGDYSAFGPIPSPDGKWIAYRRGHIGVTDLPERLVLMAADGAETRVSTKLWIARS